MRCGAAAPPPAVKGWAGKPGILAFTRAATWLAHNNNRPMNALWKFIRQRADALDISLTELARRAKKSRQTLYALADFQERLPQMETLIDLALVLDVHPLRLIHLVFEDCRLPTRHAQSHRARGDKSIFVADITIPDGTVVAAGSQFTKVWALQNVGTVAWENRFLQCMDDEVSVYAGNGQRLPVAAGLRPAQVRVAVPLTQPGETVQVAVDFQAPALPCACVSYWKSVFADGSFCFPGSVGLSVQVRVLSMTAAGGQALAG